MKQVGRNVLVVALLSMAHIACIDEYEIPLDNEDPATGEVSLGLTQPGEEPGDPAVVAGSAEALNSDSAGIEVLPGTMRLREGNNCTQNAKGEFELIAGTRVNCKSSSKCTNDDARSAEFFSARVGAIIRVYDSPSGSVGDDWTEIVVKQFRQYICLGTFQTTFDNGVLRVSYHRNNGLDGKVSRVEID